jgi:hypothetical protein
VQWKEHDRIRPVAVSLLPIDLSFTPLHADIYDPATMLAGALHRQAAATPPVNRITLRAFRSFIQHFLHSNYQSLRPDEILDFESCLETTTYSGAEKRRLREAYATSCKYPLGHGLPFKFRRGKAFGKQEFYEDVKHARGICGRHVVFKARYLQYIRAIEKRAFRLPYFAKGLTWDEIAQKLVSSLRLDGVIFENDFVSFECSFSYDVKQVCELALVRFFLCNCAPEVYKELREDARGIEMVYRWFKLYVEGKRVSGDLWTSLGNGFTNLMLILFTLFQNGFTHKQLTLLVEGDDSVGQVFGRLPNFTQTFRELGFLAKVEVRSSVQETNFCHTRVTPYGKVMSDASRVVPRFFWAHAKYANHSTDHLRMLLRARAQSLAVKDSSTPILWALLEYALRASEGSMDWVYIYRHMSVWEREWIADARSQVAPTRPSALDRAWYEVFYQVPVSVQVAVEGAILRGDFKDPCFLLLLRPLYFEGLCLTRPK